MTGAPPARERPRPPDAVETVYQVAVLSLRRTLRGGRILLVLALALFPLALSFPLSASLEPQAQERFFYGMLAFYHFGIAVPAAALTFATAFPWPEADEGTLTYWFTAPVRRFAIHLGRFLAAWIVGAVALPLGVAAIVLPLDAGPDAALGRVAVSAVSATLVAYPAYLALFWLVATALRQGLALGVVFILVEKFLSMLPINVATLTLVHYERSMVVPAVPGGEGRRPERLLLVHEPTGTVGSVVTLAAVTVLALVLSLLLVEWIEYRGKASQAT